MRIVLLGPQRNTPTVIQVAAALRLEGRIATVTAGWQERESDDADLQAAFPGRTVNLNLWARAETVFAKDPELSAAYKRRSDLLREMQLLYRFRLVEALGTAEALQRWKLDPALGPSRPEMNDLVEVHRKAATEEVRRLDTEHLHRLAGVHEEFDARWRPAHRDAVAAERRALAGILRECSAIAIAGGHVAVLLNRLRLFEIGALARHVAVLAWSAGAMAVNDRVVLFHDDPPQGAGAAEVLDTGLGLCHGVIALPHWRRRVRWDDRQRIARLAARFAPAACIAFDDGAWLALGGPTPGMELAAGVHRFRPDGSGAPDAAPPPAPEAPASAPVDVSAGDSRLAIQRLLAHGAPTPAAVDAFFQRHATLPVVEGPSVTFIYRGDAEVVNLRHFIFGLPSTQPLQRVEGTDLWYVTVEIPAGSRVEYKFEVVRGGNGEWVQDPRNPFFARDPFGANSVAQGSGYVTPEWTRPDPESRAGTLRDLEIDSAALGGRRRITLWLPARFRETRRYPLVVVHDGGDYLNYSGMGPVLDNLVHRLEVADVVVAFTYPGNRLVEYADDPRHARFLTEELVPRLESELPLLGRPEGRALMGASFGAVASFSAAWRYPGFYGRLLLQSGSFAFTDIGRRNHRGPLFDPVVAFVNAYRNRPIAVAQRVFVSCGIYESLIYENRSMLPLLQSTGMEVRYVEARDGHNWENWRDRLREGLSWLFPGPLLMLYE